MKRLEDIPKNDLFKAPEGYFDTLPSAIQARIAERRKPSWVPSPGLAFRLAVPTVILATSLIWLLNSRADVATTDELLASVNSQDLAEYINEVEMTTDDFLESIDYSKINADSLNLSDSHVIFEDEDISDVLVEFENGL